MSAPPNPPPAGFPPPAQPGQPYGAGHWQPTPGAPSTAPGAPGVPGGFPAQGPVSYPPPYPGSPYGPAGPDYPPGPPPGQFGPAGGRPTPPGPGQKRSKIWLVVVIAVVALLLCAGGVVVGGVVWLHRTRDNLVGNGPVRSAAPTPPATANGPARGGGSITVAYEVTGQGTVGIIYTDADGSPELTNAVSLPWQKQVTVANNARVEVHAVRTARGSGELVCRITVDGQEKDAKRSGAGSGTVNCAVNLGG